MARKVTFPNLSPSQHNILLTITKRRDAAQHLVRRARIILLANEQQNDEQVAPQVDLCARTVRTWRLRWCKQQKTLDTLEADGNEKVLRSFIIEVVLADDPYNGERGKYTPEQITQLYAISCEPPGDSGSPISHWTCRELSDEMVKRGIVEALPISTLWDFLKSSRLEAAQGGRLDESKVRRSRVSRAK